jgi:peptide/nickel transport system ATP-binding protein
LEELAVTYRTGSGLIPAVRGVDLTLAAGSRLGLAGESGCGKSSLASAILRLLPKSATVSGRVLLGDEDVLTMPWGRLRAVRWAEASIVFQGAMHALNPVHRIGDQIAEPILLHEKVAPAAARKRVMTLLDQVGLSAPKADAYPHELSGGQRQRVAIAGALVLDPAVLVADEPVASLDASVRGEILKLLLDLRDSSGLSALVVTHDLGLAWNIADRVAVMYLGRIVETGTAEEVLTDPQHPYTKALLSVVADEDPVILTGETPDPAAIPHGCRFHPRCPLLASGDVESVADLCRTRDLPVLPAAGRDAACHAVRVRS